MSESDPPAAKPPAKAPAPANAKKPAKQGAPGKSGKPVKKSKPKKPPRPRRLLSWAVSSCVAVAFTLVSLLIIEARQTSFYGEALLPKMMLLAAIHLNGLPQDPELRARIETVIPNLDLLPAEAVLTPHYAERFDRLGIHMGYVQQDVRPGGGKYLCRATDIGLIPAVAQNIALSLEPVPDESLKTLKLHYLVFCGDLFINSETVGGFPVPPDNTILLNLTHRTNDEEIRAFFTHEFYHLFEDRWGLVHDPFWIKKFGIGYRNTYSGIRRPENNEMGTGKWGFMNLYSESFPHEDRAEIFSALMTRPDKFYGFIQQNQDELLEAKAQYVMENVRKYMNVELGAQATAPAQ